MGFDTKTYKSIFNSYRQKRIKRVHKVYIAIAIIFLAIGFSLFFLKHHPQKLISTAKQVPIPTAIDPNFITQVNECFIPTAAVYGYDLRITSGFRSMTEQDQIYEQGRTVDGHIITEAPAGKSIHNYGFAVDVVDRWNGYNIDWIKLGKIGTYCGLEQGPEGDYPHFEHRAGLSTADFAAGLRPPPLTLPCPIMDIRAKANQALTKKDLKTCGAPSFS